MGALDKRIFSGVAIVSALLFVVSAVMLLAGDGGAVSDADGTALYVAAVAGILAVIYSITIMMDRSSFVRTVSGILVAVSGIVFLVSGFAGASTGTLLAVAAVVATITMVVDALAMWVSRVYGAMYVAIVLAVIELISAVLVLINGSDTTYHAISLLIFGIWAALSAYVSSFAKMEVDKSPKGSKKDVKKAEKPVTRSEPAKEGHGEPRTPEKGDKAPEKPAEKPAEEAVKTPEKKPEPVEKKEEPAKQRHAVRTVELPKKQVQTEASKESKAPEKKPEPVPEKKPEAKPANDFMKKLMSSQNANRVKREEPVRKEEPDVPKQALMERSEPVAEPAVEVHAESPVPEPAIVEEVDQNGSKAEEPVAEPAETTQEASSIERPAEQVPESVPADASEDVVEPGSEPEQTRDVAAATEADEDEVTEGSTAEGPESVPVPVVTIEESVPEELAEVVPTDESEPAPEFSDEGSDEQVIEEEEEFPEPDWSMVSHDAAQAEESDPVADESVPEEAPAEEPVDQIPERMEPEPAAAMEPTREVPEPEPVVEEAPAEAPSVEELQAEEVSTANEPDIQAEVPETGAEEVPEQDMYTDYSPEAVVRRAAWNKGLRCRRGYGPHSIPVAFVKGKVAVYVVDADADMSVDADLVDEGWTVLRYDANAITDGKAQAEEIAAAVKANMRSAKASSKKKSKK